MGYGGHFAAAGMTLEINQIEAFAAAFEKEVAARITLEQLIPELVIDTEIEFKTITPSFYKILCQMEPFGPDNMRPIFVARGVTDTGFSKIVKDHHVKFVVKQNGITFNGIGFNLADKFPILLSQQPFDIVFTIDENEFQGNVSLQLKVVDLLPSNS